MPPNNFIFIVMKGVCLFISWNKALVRKVKLKIWVWREGWSKLQGEAERMDSGDVGHCLEQKKGDLILSVWRKEFAELNGDKLVHSEQKLSFVRISQ